MKKQLRMEREVRRSVEENGKSKEENERLKRLSVEKRGKERPAGRIMPGRASSSEASQAATAWRVAQLRRRRRIYVEVSKSQQQVANGNGRSERERKRSGERIEGRVVVVEEERVEDSTLDTKGREAIIVSRGDETDARKLAEDLAKSIKRKIEKVEVRERKVAEPMLVVSGVEKGMTDEEFLGKLIRGTDVLVDGKVEDFKIVKRVTCRNPWKENVVLRVGLEVFKLLAKRGHKCLQVNLGRGRDATVMALDKIKHENFEIAFFQEPYQNFRVALGSDCYRINGQSKVVTLIRQGLGKGVDEERVSE
ncbi:hypothetical protein NQ314_020332 [Rhamnusium bicolor]|uniref:Uncharacterized protein n=1 Tax=Rhamnusium bicolor TaxID=1586634 RepID=A0AAV8WKF5_9CUCU|nr:hypothetical protein NQ314_020332 [Rhamnusium bicolor]